jgi:hypothetical protein
MPLFMDVHNLDSGVSMDDAAQAHRAEYTPISGDRKKGLER